MFYICCGQKKSSIPVSILFHYIQMFCVSFHGISSPEDPTVLVVPEYVRKFSIDMFTWTMKSSIFYTYISFLEYYSLVVHINLILNWSWFSGRWGTANIPSISPWLCSSFVLFGTHNTCISRKNAFGNTYNTDCEILQQGSCKMDSSCSIKYLRNSN